MQYTSDRNFLKFLNLMVGKRITERKAGSPFSCITKWTIANGENIVSALNSMLRDINQRFNPISIIHVGIRLRSNYQTCQLTKVSIHALNVRFIT